jgi:hypothetical protein
MTMKSKTAIMVMFATPAAWIVGMAVSRSTPLVQATTRPVAFTAEYLVTTHNSANIEIQHAVALFAQRADGSSVLFQKTAGLNQPAGTRRILDTSRNRVVSVDPNTKSVSTYRFSDREMEHARNPPLSCDEHNGSLSRNPDAQPKIQGLDVVRLSGKMTATENSLARWVAPGLNCFVLREEMTLVTEQAAHRRTTTSIVLGEPDPALFVIPVDYTERTPSEVLRLARESMGLPESRNAEHANRTLDTVYRSRQ